MRQFKDNGEPLISHTNDVGIMQINMKTWAKLANELELDIVNSPEDNVRMGRIIKEIQGHKAWVCHRLIDG